ncbi:L-histidine N(alpha)-methyltransferase [Chlorogloea sp. CCALA 695]|uniref:L-histidine N(alpha)-methyltransferase n=1 Tax=Chlorogloea sp. CCALA 695 TaxID=2107693 RepID=UPI000D07D8DA|nr:L-histidine N(alpha)-methyltransferase [Chlorogloea sp. CCALA 695]PSB35468.1 hypothetical protein C7B70_01115 [Chlorogloea sp. CCALA 695]
MFDVFLAHNNVDKPAVRVVCNKLRRLGIDPWLDEEQIRAGEAWHDTLQRAMTEVESVAVFIGTNGLGRWQSMELPVFITLYNEGRKIPIIPVLLPGVSRIPNELVFFKQFQAMKFENDIEDENAIRKLYDGIIGRRSNQPPKVLKRGEIFERFTDATLYLDQTSQDPIDEIRQHIDKKTLIPLRYIYSFPYGANLWISLCNDPNEYKYYAHSVNFIREEKSRIVGAIEEINPEIIRSNPDYISLGCGNGVKDKILLEEILSRSGSTQPRSYYYPYDISPVLLSKAIRRVCESDILKQSIRIKAIEADFQSLPLFDPVYQYRQEPNIFALLGNTLGNMKDDVEFLQQVREAMYPDDVLLVEVRLYQDYDTTVLSGDLQRIKQFDFTPLRWLGVNYESEKLNYSIKENESGSGAVTLTANYQNFTIEEGGSVKIIGKAKLACVHLYQKNSQGEVYGLEKVFGNKGFKIEAKFVNESTALFVLTLAPQSDS